MSPPTVAPSNPTSLKKLIFGMSVINRLAPPKLPIVSAIMLLMKYGENAVIIAANGTNATPIPAHPSEYRMRRFQVLLVLM